MAFRTGHKPLVSAECWWRDAVMSHYGEKPTWECLIKSLSKATQPLINNNNELIFVPTFFALANDFQRLLLSFMIHHKFELPEEMICQFVNAVEKNLSPNQLWVISLLRILKTDLIDSPHDDCYKFSDHNQVALTSLLSLLKDQKEICLFPKANFEGKSIDSKIEVLKSSSSLYSDDDVQIIEEEDLLTDDVCNPTEERAVGQGPKGIGKELEVSDNSNLLEADNFELSSEIQQQVAHLNFLLHETDDMQIVTPAEMQLFVTCSSIQLQPICKQLKLESLSESAFSTLCRHLVDFGNDISYENCFHLAKVCVQPKFFTQSRQISRILAAALISFTKQFPKPFIDGVLVPCAVAKKLDLPQAELVNKLVKEVFSVNHKIYLLQQLSQESPNLEAGIITLLENLLDGKLDVSIELPQLIAWFRKATTIELDNSSKYGRFILMFVNKHKKQFTTNDVSNLRRIMENHKTFIKKAVLNALKGLP